MIREKQCGRTAFLRRPDSARDCRSVEATVRDYFAAAYGISADSLKRKGDLGGTLELYRREHEIFKELRSADPSNQLAVMNFAISDSNVGEILVEQGNVPQALQRIREALAAVRAAPGSKNLWIETGLSLSYSDLGMAYAPLAETRYFRRRQNAVLGRSLVLVSERPGCLE